MTTANTIPHGHENGLNIMLIDDEKMDQMIYRRVLKRYNNIAWVGSFTSAMDALDHLRDPSAVRPHFIFLDINMPRHNGFDFLDMAIEEFGEDFVELIVFMLTTSLDPQDQTRAEGYHMIKEFVSKPLTHVLLDEILPKHL